MKLAAALLSVSHGAELLGTCATNFDECQRVTITSTGCFDREDATLEATNAQLEGDFDALTLFAGQGDFVSTSLSVTEIKDGTAGAAPDVEIVDSKGTEGVDDFWFRFNFADTVVNKIIVCGTFTTVFEEQPGEPTLDEAAWTTKVNDGLSASLTNANVTETAISAGLVSQPTTTTEATTTTAATTEASTTAGPDWETICAEPDQDLVENFNFNSGKWGVSKTMFAGQRTTLTRVNVKKRPATEQYNGAAFFARKYCGGDFLAKLADGTITFDVMDQAASYNNLHGFFKDDGGNSAYIIQWSNMAVSGNEGNAKKDKLYIKLLGLEDVNWGNKDMNECIASKLIIGDMDFSGEDHTPCLAWQRAVGNRKQE